MSTKNSKKISSKSGAIPALNYPPLNLTGLKALAIEFHAGLNNSLEAHYLLVDLDKHYAPGEDFTRIGRWLENQAMPIIGVSSTTTNGLAPFVDVIASNSLEVDRLISRINSNPVSSTLLVQVLRITRQMPIQSALSVESMAFSTLQSGAEFKAWLEQYHQDHPTPTKHVKPPESPAVLLSHHQGNLEIVLNRPDNHNAFSAEMRDALYDAFQLVAMDDTIQLARVSAAGQCFCTGGDLSEFGQFNNAAEAHLIRTLKLPSRILAEMPDRFEFHLHRACIGSGIEIPAFATNVSAQKKTYFQLPEISMGLIPGAGGCISIPRRIGRHRTAWLALTGKKINAETALAWGLIDSIEN